MINQTWIIFKLYLDLRVNFALPSEGWACAELTPSLSFLFTPIVLGSWMDEVTRD